MSNQMHHAPAGDEIDDLDVRAEDAEAVTGGFGRGEPAEDSPQGNTQSS